MRRLHTLLALFVFAAAAAAIPAQPPSATPTIHVNAHETVVDITVTDSKGNPVHGLKQSDFTVKEDGKPQSIRSFTETGSASALAPAQPLPKLPPNVYTNLRPAPANGAYNIILLDALNVPVPAQMRSRLEAIDYIKNMPPGTQIALMELDDGLRIVHDFTSDPAILIAAINDPRNTLLPPSARITIDCPPEWLDQTTLKALRDIATYVAGTKGKKNLIWFSIGMKRVTDPQFRPGCEIDPTPALHDTYALLSDAQVAIDLVDPRGLVNTSMTGFSGPITASSGAGAAAALTASMRDNNGNLLSMESVAEATGGAAFYNNNGLRQEIAKAIDHGSSYYTLSYSPPSAAYDGKYHAINVKLDRPGLHLVYRAGYYAEDPALIAHPPETLFGFKTRDTRPTGPAADPLTQAMSPLAPTATQLLFDLRAEPYTGDPLPTDPPTRVALNGKSPLTRYGFLFALPASEITFAGASPDTWSGSLEFDVVAFDPAGKIVASRSQSIPLTLTAAEHQQFLKTPFQFFQQLDLPPGQITIRAGILDRTSNHLGTLAIPLTIPRD